MTVSGHWERDMAFFGKGKLIAAAGAVASCLLTSVAYAASCGNSAAGFEQWKVEFAEKAKAAGVKKKGLAALSGAKYSTGTIRADRAAKKAFSGSVDS
jgi:membrane-bound lytic murein transglycosylase B